MECMMELHSVLVVMDEFNDASIQVYGEILVQDRGPDLFYIFKEEKDNSKSIYTDGTLPLVGLRQCILSPDVFIKVSLKEKNEDLEICDGYFMVSPNDDDYDKPCSITIAGQHGHVVVHWTMFESAVQATLDAAFFTKADIGSYKPAISGRIVALCRENEYEDDFERMYFQTMLLNEPHDEPKGLVSDEKPTNSNLGGQKFRIPLSRVAVAVPEDKSLFMKANLRICFPEASTQYADVGGTVSFPAETSTKKCSRSIIEFEYGHIEIKATWLPDVWLERERKWEVKMMKKKKNRASKTKRLVKLS